MRRSASLSDYSGINGVYSCSDLLVNGEFVYEKEGGRAAMWFGNNEGVMSWMLGKSCEVSRVRASERVSDSATDVLRPCKVIIDQQERRRLPLVYCSYLFDAHRFCCLVVPGPADHVGGEKIWAYLDATIAGSTSSLDFNGDSWRVYSYESLSYEVQHDVHVTSFADGIGLTRASSRESEGTARSSEPVNLLAQSDASDICQAPAPLESPAFSQQEDAGLPEQGGGQDGVEERRNSEDDNLEAEMQLRREMEGDMEEAAEWSESWVRYSLQ